MLSTRTTTSDGVELHWEESGHGTPILFVHEFAGDHRSWSAQVKHFAKSHRAITYAARGYPPSEVPPDVASYSQQRAMEDALSVLDAAKVESAHVVGLSMGGFATLHLLLAHPDRVHSALIAGVGYGSQPEKQEQFRKESNAIADAFASQGAAAVAETYAVGPARVQLQNKQRDAWEDFKHALAKHDATGAANTMRGVQAARPSLYALTDELTAIRKPVLIVAGDEDDGSLEPSLMLKRTISTAALAVFPGTGHTINLEEPDEFNQILEWFIGEVDSGNWAARDPRATVGSITGVKTS